MTSFSFLLPPARSAVRKPTRPEAAATAFFFGAGPQLLLDDASGPRIRSFAPLLGDSPTRLVLGSMPGQASLAASQYYAHPRNAFWPIMGELFGAHPQLDYRQRVGKLTGAGIAVWDVLGECVRPGSLDSEIQREGRVANDFAQFLRGNPAITAIYFNGGMAAELFRRLVLPILGDQRTSLHRLPSTSPANARMTLADKLAAWRMVGVQ